MNQPAPASNPNVSEKIAGLVMLIFLVCGLTFSFWIDLKHWYYINRDGVVASATVSNLRGYSRAADTADLTWIDGSGRQLTYLRNPLADKTWNELKRLEAKGVDALTIDVKHIPFPNERLYPPIPVKDLNYIKWLSIIVGGSGLALIVYFLFIVYLDLQLYFSSKRVYSEPGR